MPRLVHAQAEHVQQIYRESHPLWGAGLSLEDYVGLWNEVSSTDWAKENVRFFVWLADDGRLLSSLKMYRPQLQLLGEVERTVVLGAIFTPRLMRRKGHAAAAMRAALDVGYAAGAASAMLFSDIGSSYYENFGFEPIPADEHWGALEASLANPPDGWTMRDMVVEDLPLVRQMHGEFGSSRPFAIVRDDDHWEFVQRRAESFFERLRSSHLRQRWQVATLHGEVAGYLISVEGRGEWNVREVGALGGHFSGMANVLRTGAVGALSNGLRRFYAWLPHELLEYLEEWKIHSRPRRGALPMVLPLSGTVELPALQVPGACYIPYQDQF